MPAVPAVQIIGEDDRTVRAVADEFGVYLKPSSYGMDVKPLVKEACRWAHRVFWQQLELESMG